MITSEDVFIRDTHATSKVPHPDSTLFGGRVAGEFHFSLFVPQLWELS